MTFALSEIISMRGYAIHSGERSEVTVLPSESAGLPSESAGLPSESAGLPSESAGLRWQTDANSRAVLLSRRDYHACVQTSLVSVGRAQVRCPEHLLAALALHDIRSATVRTTNVQELPVFPEAGGSYYDQLVVDNITDTLSGHKPESTGVRPYELMDEHSRYFISPGTAFSCEVQFTAPNGASSSALITQDELTSGRSSAKERISRARTWIRWEDHEEILQRGLCKGLGKTRWCRVLRKEDFDTDDVVTECTEHKLYDLLGDLYLLGYWPPVKIVATNPSHRLNVVILNYLSSFSLTG
jgi:UDP-3-O-[3-hydroxymyristoyl] N-acetylglucosamine deacetylase